MRLLYWLCLLGGLGCVLAACGAAPAVATIPPEEFKLVLQDKFDSEDKGWDKFIEDGKGQAGYDENQYRIQVTASNTHIWANPKNSSPPSDVHISVDARKEDGDTNNLYGVICRYQDEKNFYFFVISSDGYFGVGKVKDGQYQLINRRDYPPSSAILTEHQTNKIYVECVGQDLRLYVNNQFVDEQTDDELKTGNVGLIAGTLGGGTVIVFDNFEVRGP